MQDSDSARLLLEIIPHAMRAIRREMRDVAKDRLTVPQFRVLNRLSRTAMQNRELAEWMGVSAPTMSNMVELLVTRGLVSRRAQGSDRRQVVLACTKRGDELAKEIRSSVQKKFTKRLAELAPEQLRALELGLSVLKGLQL